VADEPELVPVMRTGQSKARAPLRHDREPAGREFPLKILRARVEWRSQSPKMSKVQEFFNNLVEFRRRRGARFSNA
jgi:hypothetical protein